MKENTKGALIFFGILVVVVFVIIGLGGGIGGFKDRPVLDANIHVRTDTAHISTKVMGVWDIVFIDIEGNIKIKVDPDTPGTLLTVKDWFLYRGYACRAEHVVITVRTEEQKKAWEERIEQAREKFKKLKGVRDIPPPEVY